MILGASGPTIGEMQPNTSYVVLYCTNGTTTTYCLLPTAANQYLTFDVNGTPQCSPMPSNGATGATGATGPQGAKGDTGSTGSQGIKGDTGAQGSTGSAGSQGATGSSGAAATISVGSVSTGAAGSSATVTNTGTSSAAVLAFAIPQGAVGATGSTGPTGAAGTSPTLSSSNPVALAATASPGTASAASRQDHVHPLPSGINALLSTVTIAETSITTLTLGVRRVTVSVTGAVTTGNYLPFAVSSLTAGYALVDAICTTNGQITFGILVPILTIGSYSFSVRAIQVGT